MFLYTLFSNLFMIYVVLLESHFIKVDDGSEHSVNFTKDMLVCIRLIFVYTHAIVINKVGRVSTVNPLGY